MMNVNRIFSLQELCETHSTAQCHSNFAAQLCCLSETQKLAMVAPLHKSQAFTSGTYITLLYSCRDNDSMGVGFHPIHEVPWLQSLFKSVDDLSPDDLQMKPQKADDDLSLID